MKKIDSKEENAKLLHESELFKENLLKQYAQLLSLGMRLETYQLMDCVFYACQFGDEKSLRLSLEQLGSEAKTVLQFNSTDLLSPFNNTDLLSPLEIAIRRKQLAICHYL